MLNTVAKAYILPADSAISLAYMLPSGSAMATSRKNWILLIFVKVDEASVFDSSCKHEHS